MNIGYKILVFHGILLIIILKPLLSMQTHLCKNSRNYSQRTKSGQCAQLLEFYSRWASSYKLTTNKRRC